MIMMIEFCPVPNHKIANGNKATPGNEFIIATVVSIKLAKFLDRAC